MTEHIVIVGAGLAGAKAAETLRTDGFAGRVTLVGNEEHRPYERPPLSKKNLLDPTAGGSVFVHSAQWYADSSVDLRVGTSAESIDVVARIVTLTGVGPVGYDKLLLASGSSPIQLRIPGTGLGGVRYLRTLNDSREIASAIGPGRDVVIIGGGWIGLEVAAAASQAGAHVSVVETAVLPLLRVLGPELAEVFTRVHRANGVSFHLASSVRQIEGGERVTGVRLDSGETLAADLVVIGVGIRPNTDIAARAGITVDNGVVTDAALRTSDPQVYACGDVANSFNPLLGRHVRVEHWANALNGGPAAARSMLGQEVVYDRVPYFFSDQYELGLEYAGYVEPGDYDQVVFRGDPTGQPAATAEFVAFWLKQGRVLAGMNVNVWDVQDDIQKLVRAGHSGTAVDVRGLTDPSVPLAALLT